MLGCSFDNKSGIWNSESNPKIGKENQVFSDFETLSTKQDFLTKLSLLEVQIIIYLNK